MLGLYQGIVLCCVQEGSFHLLVDLETRVVLQPGEVEAAGFPVDLGGVEIPAEYYMFRL